jgi:hypothetical protein
MKNIGHDSEPRAVERQGSEAARLREYNKNCAIEDGKKY